MDQRQCGHCSEGALILDIAAGICACSSCGRIDESVVHLVEEPAFNGGYERVLSATGAPTLFTKRGALRENLWIETIDLIGSTLRLPARVVAEAKSFFFASSDVHGNRMYGRKLLSGVLLLAACRRCGIPLTMPEMATVIGVRPSIFVKHYKFVSFHAQWKLPSLSLSQLIDRCTHEIEGDLVSPCGQLLAAKGRFFKDECRSLIQLFAQTEMHHNFCNPVFLSVIYMAWRQMEGRRKEAKMELWLCQRFGIRLSTFQERYRKVRHCLVDLCSRIPGAMPCITIRNVEHFIPLLQGYYQRVHAVHEHLHDRKGSVRKEREQHLLKRRIDEGISGPTKRQALRRPLLSFHVHPVIEENAKEAASLTKEGRGKDVWNASSGNGSTSQRMRLRREKRKRGFNRFLQEVNARRRSEGREEIYSHCGTSELSQHGRVAGYCFSLPSKHFSGDVSEIRKGPYKWTYERLPKAVQTRSIRSPKAAMKRADVVSDTGVESYLLKPQEVLLKTLCMEMSDETAP